MTQTLIHPGLAEDMAEAERLGISVSQLQAQRRFNEVADRVLGPAEEDEDLIKAREVLAKKAAEVARRESERNAEAQRWVAIQKRAADIDNKEKRGEYLVECAEGERASCEETITMILNQKHPMPHFNEYPNGILTIGGRLAAAREVLNLVPAWRESLKAEKEANEADRAAFISKHKIEGNIPTEEPPAKHSVRKECCEVRVIG